MNTASSPSSTVMSSIDTTTLRPLSPIMVESEPALSETGMTRSPVVAFSRVTVSVSSSSRISSEFVVTAIVPVD